MERRRVSLGFLGIFGRSPELRELDDAFRAIDVHPRLVPDAVKLVIVGQLREHARAGEASAPRSVEAAEIVGYCMLGAEAFADANGPELAHRVERRIEAALDTGNDGLDARLILLTLHARIAQPSVIERYGLESIAD
jgi:hypothetical protein